MKKLYSLLFTTLLSVFATTILAGNSEKLSLLPIKKRFNNHKTMPPKKRHKVITSTENSNKEIEPIICDYCDDESIDPDLDLNSEPANPLWKTIKNNNEKEALQLLSKDDQGINILGIWKMNNGDQEDNVTLLHLAAYNGNVNIIKCLLQKGLTIDAQTSLGNTALNIAVAENKCNAAHYLIQQGANVNLASTTIIGDLKITNMTPLHHAAMHGNTNILQQLIKVGANIEAKNSLGNTPLLVATIYNHTNTAQYLIAQNANGLCTNNNQDGPIHYAVLNNNKKMAKLLISKNNAVLNQRNSKNQTPAELADFMRLSIRTTTIFDPETYIDYRSDDDDSSYIE